ncbi:MAG: mechanosensitive ion channel domain-containing protein, partial [Pseudomonadota bacterium]
IARTLSSARSSAPAPASVSSSSASVSAMLAPPAASDASHEGHAAADPESDAEDEETDAGAGALLRALLKVLAIAVAVATPAAALLSFPELARFLIEKAAGTVVLLATAGLAYDTILRVIAAERGGESGAWAPLAIGLLVAAVLAPNLALLWGATAADLRAVFRVLFEGVEVDGARFGLFDVLAGIGIFLLGVTLTRLGQRGLRKSVLRQTRMDAGLQSSISAGIGYTGVLLSVLIAVSAVGLDLSSLALVAGALSVGIGFGLQAIVNNFVSGIVLLVERPIKSGDWIRVGEAEGYVRRINARSTLIEKFDKSTVIVPNSELVANQVTNLTHRNLAGRATIRIRASFDTDPARVIAIMEAVALSHESVLSYPQPLAMFRSVSDSGLEFELWAYLGNVNLVFNVHSDLMVMLWKRLREEGVEVPYPQTGLHVRSLPAAANGAAATASAVIAPPESAATLSRD